MNKSVEWLRPPPHTKLMELIHLVNQILHDARVAQLAEAVDSNPTS